MKSMMKRLFPALLLAAPGWLAAAPIEIVNPSGEVNNGIDRTSIADASVIGWDADGGTAQVIDGGTDYGNGRWRLTIEDSAEAFQMTSHEIVAGDAFSLRFDAAMFAGNLPGEDFVPDLTLVGPGVRNGDFNSGTGGSGDWSFAETAEWFNLAGNQATQATRTNVGFDGTRNAVLAQGGSRQFGVDTGHTLSTGERFQASFVWRDASNWDDATDVVRVILYTTGNDQIDGARTVLETLDAPVSTTDSTYEPAVLTFGPVPALAAGKRLFAMFEGIGNGGFARLDNFTLQRGTVGSGVPDRQIIAELYVDDGGARLPVASRTYDFKTPFIGSWDHYHLAVPAGALDAHAGETVGVRFRSNGQAVGNFQSFDKVRLDVWPDSPPDGSFADDWNSTPDQVWAGPGYWANRLQDWEVDSGRVNCIRTGRDRRTLHRAGTSVRGHGGDFSLSVRTGLHLGSLSSGARTGFLVGAAPALDWRGALLVHDGLGRDFGLFVGLDGNGTPVIEDYGTGSVTAIATGVTPVGGFVEGSRLEFDATYASGSYLLELSVYDPSDTLLGSVSTAVPSDRVLGNFGLLSHRGGNSAAFWFDDFSGSGGALQEEPERHLAILGAMYTLSRGTLNLTAQLSPVDLATTPPVALEIWENEAWQEIATVPIDNTDSTSSYTATFRVPNWDVTIDREYRIRVDLGGTSYYWAGLTRKDPVEKEELVVAAITCQRISDGNIQNDGTDWSPVGIWHPHNDCYGHLTKHLPDLLVALGDQIYEGQPTPEDSNDDFIRQHDYLYKWYLWVLQAREVTRRMPTIAMPDDHDIYQGNLWGESGIATANQNSGGYEEPAPWVKMTERTQCSHLPAPDPYNPVQPAPPVNQGIEVYFTAMIYGGVGFAVIEDRKFKTGPQNPPVDLEQQFLIGNRQKDFLRAWADDWDGQAMKCVVSQSPFGNLHTHAGGGYNFNLNDKDTHGWPVHRRNEVWELLRLTRMFQISGDQHLATVAHHGVEGPRDAGFSFTVPAVANFFPRGWDPVHNSSGTTPTVSPYQGDFYFDGSGTLPDGSTPNLTAQDPHHFAIVAAANPRQYYQQVSGINPSPLHDRGAGYGIVRMDKTTRRIRFECWPLYPDPEYPQMGGQYADWPVELAQTDNDGRAPTGYLPVIDTNWRKDAVVRIYDESSGELVYSMRVRGNRFRPPVYDNGTTYRVELSYGDDPVAETSTALVPSAAGPAAIHDFRSVQPSIVAGETATLSWDVSSPGTLTLDQGIGDVLPFTVDGIGFLEVTPAVDTTYTLTLDGGATATTTVRVFPGKPAWLDAHFSPAEQADPQVSGDGEDPDGDGVSNADEFRFQTDPRDASDKPLLRGSIVEDGGMKRVVFDTAWPLDAEGCTMVVETTEDLDEWTPLPANSYEEIARDDLPGSGTARITLRLVDELPVATHAKRFYRGRWIVP